MNDIPVDRSRSPFSELSFSQQQEMWRMWRAQPLAYQEIKPEACTETKTEVKSSPAPPAVPQRYIPPEHKNLDRVHARITAAAAHTSAFRPLTARE